MVAVAAMIRLPLACQSCEHQANHRNVDHGFAALY